MGSWRPGGRPRAEGGDRCGLVAEAAAVALAPANELGGGVSGDGLAGPPGMVQSTNKRGRLAWPPADVCGRLDPRGRIDVSSVVVAGVDAARRPPKGQSSSRGASGRET